MRENKSALLNNVAKVFKTDKYLVVKCYNRSALFFFNHQGEYVKKVVATGQGPYEFANLMDVSYNKKNGEFFLLDFENRKLLKYSLGRSEIISESSKNDTHFYSMFNYNNSLYLVSEPSDAGRIKILDDSTYELLGGGVHGAQESFNFVVTQDNIKVFKDTLFFNVSFTDTIYYSTGKSIKPYAVLGSGDESFSSVDNKLEYMKRSVSGFDKMTPEEKKVLVPVGFFSVYKNIWFIDLVWPYKMIVWNRSNNAQMLLDYRKIKNRSLLFNYRLFHIHYVDDDGFAYSSLMLNSDFYRDAQQVIESDEYGQGLVDSLEGILSAFPEGSGYENPIIVKFKLNTNFLI